jgi:pimeloyl-ACP methyl ester carboxylesterase
MDGALTFALLFLIASTLPVLCGAAWLAMERGQPLTWSRAGVSWFFRESAAHAVIAAIMLFGWWPNSPERKHKQRDIAERPASNVHRNPVLLVHGYGLNRACFAFLQTYLHTRGWEWVWSVNHRPRSSPIPVFGKRLGRSIERLKEATGAEQIDIVAHSMGGIVTAYALQEFGYGHHVRRLITLGTPWAGTRTFVFGRMREARDLAPDSEVIGALEGYTGDTVALWSQHDHMVSPTTSAAPTHAQCIEFEHLGHMEMLTSPRIFRTIADQLVIIGPEEE